jgi:hypothetical protein
MSNGEEQTDYAISGQQEVNEEEANEEEANEEEAIKEEEEEEEEEERHWLRYRRCMDSSE